MAPQQGGQEYPFDLLVVTTLKRIEPDEGPGQ
jgi:hypothetical protein